jgi:hypothetical protein
MQKKKKKKKKKKTLHPTTADSHHYFFFFLQFLLLSHFFLPTDKESVGRGFGHDPWLARPMASLSESPSLVPTIIFFGVKVIKFSKG